MSARRRLRLQCSHDRLAPLIARESESVLTPDTVVRIRQYRHHVRRGTVKFSDLREVHWRRIFARSPRRILCAHLWSDAGRIGAVELICDKPPHDTVVYIVKADNPELYPFLAALAQ
jgi:hypothetical protein